ncbi:MAG: hypothetical protein RR962_04200 [Hafnia sp.]
MENFKLSLAIVVLIMGIASLVLVESIGDEKSISYHIPSPSENGVVDGIELSNNTLGYKQVYLIIVCSPQEPMQGTIIDAEILTNLTMMEKSNIDVCQKNTTHAEVPSACASDVGLPSSGTENLLRSSGRLMLQPDLTTESIIF